MDSTLSIRGSFSFVIFLVFSILLSGCFSSNNDSSSKPVVSCPTLTGNSWVPTVQGASLSNRDLATGALDPSPAPVVVSATGPITGLGQPAGVAQEITVSIPMDQDLGAYGSLSLTAEMTAFPGSMIGTAYPILVSLNDGTNELINLTRSGGNDCAGTGYFVCSGPSNARICAPNPNCTIQSPSAFQGLQHWLQGQLPTVGSVGVISFPTCNWSGTASPVCHFMESNLFPASPTPRRLRFGSGLNYTAKYTLIADSYETVTAGRTGSFKVTAIRKKDTNTSKGGAVDVNVILVGSDNIQASRTPKGQQNLDLLFEAFQNYWSQSNVNIKIGDLKATEWTCEQGGDAYANISVSSLGDLFKYGSSGLGSGDFNRAVNIFLVSSIINSPSDPFTILGVSGGIPGPAKNGTTSSGVVFSTFGDLANFNPNCTTGNPSSCTSAKQERDFWNMGTTIAHEVGHYLGLNHLSEKTGLVHDPVSDTPKCTNTQTIPNIGTFLTVNSCLNDTNLYMGNSGDTCSAACPGYSLASSNFCPSVIQCQFNHIMWYTTKNFKEGTGLSDGNLFSPYSGEVLNYSPLVR